MVFRTYSAEIVTYGLVPVRAPTPIDTVDTESD